MKRKSTLKDKLTNYAGLVILLSGAVWQLSERMQLPEWMTQSAIIGGTLAAFVMANLIGKGDDGKRKPIQHNPYK